MPSTYPTSIDSFTANTDDVDDVLAEDINELQDAIEAIETKLGTGSSTPANAKILKGNGVGSSAWDLDFKDEDDMASNSATAVPSQQSTKAYVDGRTPAATDAATGVVELATDEEALAGSSDSVVLTPGNLGYTGFLTGWIPSSDTWIYSSATTFTISGDKTDKYFKGAKVMFTDGGSTTHRCYVVSSTYSSPNTTVTVASEDDIASGTITNPYYSYADCPQGFKRGEDWYKVSMYCGSRQALTDSTYTQVNLTAKSFDPNNIGNTTTKKITIPISGYYQLNFAMNIGDDSINVSRVIGRIKKNTDTTVLGIYNYGASSYNNNASGSKLVYLEKGETLWLQAYAYGSSTGFVTGLKENSYLTAQFIGL